MSARQIDIAYAPRSAAREPLLPRGIMRAVTNRVRIVIGIAAACTLLACAYAIFSTPMYAADALVQVEVPKQNELADLVSKQQDQTASSPNGPPTETEMALIKSREVLAPVIAANQLDLSVTPHRFPLIGKMVSSFATPGILASPWFGMSSYAWGGELLEIAQLDLPVALQDQKLELLVLGQGHYRLLDEHGKVLIDGIEGQVATEGDVSISVRKLVARNGERFTVKLVNQVTAVAQFIKQLKVFEVGKETGVIQMSFENSDPVLATAVVNSIIQNYIASHLTRDQEEASKMLAFINGGLPGLRDNLKRAELQLQSHRVASGSMQASSESQSYLQGSIAFTQQIAALNLQRTQLLDRFTAQSDQVKIVDAQLGELRAEKDKFEARFNSLPAADRKSADLTRDAKVAEDIYVAMLNKANELSLSRAGSVGNVHVVDRAVEPSTPVKPRRMLIITAAMFLGLMLGTLYVIAQHYLSQSISEPEQIEERLRLQLFGSVMFSSEQARLAHPPKPLSLPGELVRPARGRRALQSTSAKRRNYLVRPHAGALLAATFPHDAAMEALRGVRTMLTTHLINVKDRTVMFTGATPATGKSFIAANLALLYAQAGKRVLLIDADLRHGQLGASFGLPPMAGLAELLAGDVLRERAVHRSNLENLWLLPAGMRPANPAELLATECMPELLEYWNAHYDLVLLDTPPVLAVSDALILARHAGATVLVLREHTQTEFEVEETLRHLDRAGAHISGAIYNGMLPRRSDRRSRQYVEAYTGELNA